MQVRLKSAISALLGIGLIGLGAASDPAAAISRQVRGTTNTNVNRANVAASQNVANRNVNVNRSSNVNVNRNVNVDIDHGRDCCYHPVAAAAAITATAAAIGSIVYTLPPSCSVTAVNGVTYQNCGGTWYQPQYVGTSVQYVVVEQP